MGPSMVGRYGRSMIYISIFTRVFEGPIANIGTNLKNTQDSMVCIVKLKTDFEVDFIEAIHAPVKRQDFKFEGCLIWNQLRS